MHIRPSLIAAICFFAAASATTEARILDTPTAGEIPFTLADDNRIYVTASVNGSDSLRFLVDTGASSIVLNPNSPKLHGHIHQGETASNLGTSRENTIQYSNDNTVAVGTILYNSAGCAHIPYPPEFWDGVLGLNALSAFNIEINYDDSKIYCYPKNEPLQPEKSLVKLAFTYIYNVPFIELPVRLNGTLHNLTLEVDTGSDRVIDINTPFVNKHRLLETQAPFAISRITSSDGGGGELHNVYFDEVIIGPYTMPRVAGAYSTLTVGMQSKDDIDGMIGNNMLKRFNMLIDFACNYIYLQPNNNYYTPFYPTLTTPSSP